MIHPSFPVAQWTLPFPRARDAFERRNGRF